MVKQKPCALFQVRNSKSSTIVTDEAVYTPAQEFKFLTVYWTDTKKEA
jgi:hypothetical protein